MTNDKVFIYIDAPGDSSAGLTPYSEQIELSSWPDIDQPEERVRVRDIFQRAFAELIDDRVNILFGDECGGCHKLKVNCLCPDEYK